MRIEVTQEDIEKGRPASFFWCPVARAVRRATGYPAKATYGRVSVQLSPGPMKPKLFCSTPLMVDLFIGQFDLEEPVEPFAFDLPELEDWK